MIDIIIPTIYAKKEDVLLIDKLKESIRQHTHHKYKIEEVHGTRGFIKAVNSALFKSDNDIIILNDDTEVSEKWLHHLLTYQNLGDILGVRTCLPSGYVESIGGAIRSDAVATLLGFGLFDLGQFDFLYYPPFVGFSCVLIKRHVIQTLGKLDESYGKGYWDDVDYCLRAWETGFKVLYTPVPIIHHGGASFRTENRQMNTAFLENRKLWMDRWIATKRIEAVIPKIQRANTALVQIIQKHI